MTLNRTQEMATAYRNGETLQQIGDRFGLCRERVRRIIAELGLTRRDGGHHARAKVKSAAKAADLEARTLQKWGCSRQQYLEIRSSTKTMNAFFSQRANADKRGVEWKLTFWQWYSAWQESGKWDQRGRGAHDYVMCRHGDVGPYSLENIYFATGAENVQHAHLNKRSVAFLQSWRLG